MLQSGENSKLRAAELGCDPSTSEPSVTQRAEAEMPSQLTICVLFSRGCES